MSVINVPSKPGIIVPVIGEAASTLFTHVEDNYYRIPDEDRQNFLLTAAILYASTPTGYESLSKSLAVARALNDGDARLACKILPKALALSNPRRLTGFTPETILLANVAERGADVLSMDQRLYLTALSPVSFRKFSARKRRAAARKAIASIVTREPLTWPDTTSRQAASS